MSKENGFLRVLSKVIEKGTKIPEDLHAIAFSVKTLSSEIIRLSQAVTQLAHLVRMHEETIDQIVSIQNFLLNKISSDDFEDFAETIKKEKNYKLN